MVFHIWSVCYYNLSICIQNISLHFILFYKCTIISNPVQSPKEPTIPRDRIGRIVWKGDKASPFYDPSGNMVKPFARLRIQKLRTYEQECQRGHGHQYQPSNNYNMGVPGPDYGGMMGMGNMDDIYDDSEDRDRRKFRFFPPVVAMDN